MIGRVVVGGNAFTIEDCGRHSMRIVLDLAVDEAAHTTHAHAHRRTHAPQTQEKGAPAGEPTYARCRRNFPDGSETRGREEAPLPLDLWNLKNTKKECNSGQGYGHYATRLMDTTVNWLVDWHVVQSIAAGQCPIWQQGAPQPQMARARSCSARTNSH